jgi:hypothetical protein
MEDFEFDFSAMTDDEIKDAVVRNVERINNLKEDKKSYSKGINDTIKETEARNKAACEELDMRSGKKKQ